MSFYYSRRNLSKRERFLERFLQILPGSTSWGIILGLLFLAFWKPLVAAIFIIVFDFYWLLRLFYLTIFLSLAYVRLSMEKTTDWSERIKTIDDYLENASSGVSRSFRFSGHTISKEIQRREMEYLLKAKALPPKSADIYHLVILPVIGESQEVVEPGIRSYLEDEFPAKRILVVMAVEDRAGDHVKRGARKLREKYAGSFYDFLIVIHPAGLPNEAAVKGANVTWAAREAKRYLDGKKIPAERVIVSCFDADTIVSPHYFSCLTYYFMICPKRTQASFQPIPVYHNNIWRVPGFARVIEMGASFFQLVEATHPEKLVTFSSHSMSFKALVEIGFWPVDMISDDSAIFWKAYIHYEGDYRVVPMYITLSMDVAEADSFWKNCVSVYRQKRRWAWGIENFPIVMRGFIQSRKISLFDKLRHGFKLFEGHIAWATWPFLLGIIGWLPALFAGREFSSTVVYYTAPRIAHTIFNLAGVSLFATIVLSLRLLPKKKIRYSFFRRMFHALEWLLIPVVAVFFSGMPALDAQTRLMLGRYMEFRATEKRR